MSIRTGSILSRTLACVAALTLGGCLTAQYPVTKRVPGAEALINFEDPSLRDAKVVRIHHLDAFEHVAYARFETDQLTLEAVYDTALGEGLALQYDYWMERMANTWNALRSQNKAWGEKVTLAAQHNEMDFQPFRLADGRQCAGFNSEWDFDPRDSFGRPTRVLFGYVCARPGAKVSEKRLAKIMSGISINQRYGETFVPVRPQRSVDQVAFNTAVGADGSATGNEEFPFNFGTTIDENDGGDDGSEYSG